MNRMKYVHLFALLSIFAFSSPGQSACVSTDPCHKDLDTQCRDKYGDLFAADITENCPEDHESHECDGYCEYIGDREVAWFRHTAQGSLPK